MGTCAADQDLDLGVPRAVPRRGLFAGGVALGVLTLMLFGTLHALLIVPIWAKLYRGAPYAIAVGVAVTWAYHEARIGDSARAGIGDGARFGVLAWLVAVPAMALGFGMRSIPGWGQVHWTVDVGTVVLAAAGGATLLWVLTRTRRAALAGAVAVTLVHAYNGGPMPIDVPLRAVGMPIGFLAIHVMGGAVIGGCYARLVSRARTIS